MKKLILTSMAAMAVATAADAADPKPYAAAKLGFTPLNIMDFETMHGSTGMTPSGFYGSVAGGVSLEVTPRLAVRGELEYSHSSTNEERADSLDSSKISFSLNALSINGYIDFGDKTWFSKPYIGLGLGSGSGTFDVEDIKLDGDPSGVVLSILAGFAYVADDNLSLDFGIKYARMSAPDLQTTIDTHGYLNMIDFDFSIGSLSILFGARYMF